MNYEYIKIVSFLPVNTIMLAKPEKGRQVESVIVQMASSGQIAGRLSENDLIGLVERVNAQTQKTTSVKVSELCQERLNVLYL